MTRNSEVASLQEYKDKNNTAPKKELPVINEWTGDFKLRFRGILLDVRALRPEDVSEIFGVVKKPAEEKEQAVKNDIGERLHAEPSLESIKIDGEKARQTILETASGIKGLTEIVNFFKQCANPDSITDATDFQLMVIKPGSKGYAEYKYEGELKGPALNRSPIYEDSANANAQMAFMVTREKGAEFMDIMQKNDHKIFKLPSGNGFQVEINGFRMEFLYPPEKKIVLGEDSEKMVDVNDNATSDEDENVEDVAA